MPDEQLPDGQGEGAPVVASVGPDGEQQPSAEGAGTSDAGKPDGGKREPDVEHAIELWRREQSRADKATSKAEKLEQRLETLESRLHEMTASGASEASIQREREETVQRLAERWGWTVEQVRDQMAITESIATRVRDDVLKKQGEKYDRKIAELESRLANSDPRFMANRQEVERVQQEYGLSREQAVKIVEKELKRPAAPKPPNPGTMAAGRSVDRSGPDPGFAAELEAVQAIPGVPKVSAANRKILEAKWRKS